MSELLTLSLVSGPESSYIIIPDLSIPEGLVAIPGRLTKSCNFAKYFLHIYEYQQDPERTS